MLPFLHHWFSDLAGLFFPQSCAVCGRTLRQQEEILCTTCSYKLPRTGFHLSAENPVKDIFSGRLPLAAGTAFLFFSKGGEAQQLIHQLKYKGRRDIGNYLGRLFGAQLMESDFFREVDVLVPVPLHPRKEFLRGYNQSRLVAEGMASQMSAVVMPDVLYRTKHSDSQTKKSRYERWENVKDIFALKNGSRLENKHVLLVDDVITTGATLEACGNVLLQVPGIRLSVASLAYAQG
jgi:ComF family protein